MKEYEQKIYNIIGNAREEVIFQTNQAYKNGYMDGYVDGKDGQKEKLANAMIYDHEEAEKKAYNRGLDEAWEVIKKITKDDSVGGYSLEMMKNLFSHTCVYDIVHNYTASEALAKIKAYADKQKQDAEIKIGDEVITKYKDHAVAVRDTYYLGEDKEPFTLIWFGTHMSSCPVNELSKTGKNYPQIAEILAELRGTENDE